MSEEPAQPALPADVPPALRAAVATALAWLRELDREAVQAAREAAPRRPR
jgi:hypothetical protein